MRQRQTLSDNQKKRIIQWDIPHLLALLENRYSFSVMHLMTPVLSFLNRCPGGQDRPGQEWPSYALPFSRGCLVFNGKTGFPILMGKDSFGVIIVLRALAMEEAQSVRDFIDSYFQKLFLYRTRTGIHSPVCFSAEENKKLSSDHFPLLLQRKKKDSLLKEAHDIYLKTKAFAFLNTEDLKWEEGVFQEMEDVFLCVPSFPRLSLFQKTVLIQSLLKKELPGPLVVGIQEEEDLPRKWQKLFPAIL